MSRIADVLMERDGLTREEARQQVRDARREFYDMLADGADYDDIEDMMASEFGLEMDYIDDLI